jgi:hypothetical protein
MKPEKIISEVQAIGGTFVLDDEGFRVRAPKEKLTPDLCEALAAYKPEIIALLSRTETLIQKTTIPALYYPRCFMPVVVWTHPMDDEVWFNCADCRLFKTLKHAAGEWCADCGVKFPKLCGRCAGCISLVMLAPDAPCPRCNGLRFWRHRTVKNKHAGFVWYCIECFEPADKVAVYKLSE